MQQTQLFDWKDFDYDIHIGGSKSASRYHYPDLRDRSFDMRKRYQKRKREKQNAKQNQLS